MRVVKLEIDGFRNFKKLSFTPGDQVNVVYGENAQGKTNLMEALWLFTGAKSFRAAKDVEMVGMGRQEASLRLQFVSQGREQEASVFLQRKRTATLNGVALARASMLAGAFCAVVFSPSDLSLIDRGPEQRRRFLDAALCQIYPRYISIMREYARALSQRNRLLKDYRYQPSLEPLMQSFEEELTRSGTQIIAFRLRYLEALSEVAPAIYEKIAQGKERMTMTYEATATAETLEDALRKNRQADAHAGFTAIGPHRDDLNVKINDLAAKRFGSQGQKRSAALALKLGEAKLLFQKTGERPVVLLDDVMSELDETRREIVMGHIHTGQTFITCCEKIASFDSPKIKRFFMKQGMLEEERTCI